MVSKIDILDTETGYFVPLGEHRVHEHLDYLMSPRPLDKGWWCLHCGVHNPNSNTDNCTNGC